MLDTTDLQATTDIRPPELFSLEAEENLIAGVLIWERAALDRITVEADDFYSNRNRAIWNAVTRLLKSGREPDLIAISECLKTPECKDGDFLYLAQISNNFVGGLNLENLADIIKGYSRRRRLIALATDIAKAAYNPQVNITSASADFINRLVSASDVKRGAVHWREYLTQLCDQVDERAKNPQDIWGIPTGFATFDRTTGGLQPGELLILSGKPGVGKSFMAMQMAEQMGRHTPGGVYSKEMGALQVIRRQVASVSGIPARNLKSGRLADDEWGVFVNAVDTLASYKVFLTDAPYLTTTSLRADLARLKAQEGIQWFVLDYLMLLDDMPGRDEIEKTGAISRALKLICRQLDLAGVVVHSMNKIGIGKDNGRENKTIPGMEDLRGSGQVIYDADLICFLTEFQAIAPEDGKIRESERQHMRTLFFGKGRELEDPRKFIHFVQMPSARFGEYAR